MFAPALVSPATAIVRTSGRGMFSAILLVAAVIAVIDSPQRWQTFKRVGIAFVATMIVGLLAATAIAPRYSSSGLARSMGEYTAYLAMASASAFGWYHVRNLRRPPK